MFQWSDDYNAQTIFDQVWKAPYSWFINYQQITNTPWKVRVLIQESDDHTDLKWSDPITAEDIDKAIIPTYKQWMNLPPDHPRFTSFAHWIEDLDANDVDAILQMAVFGEIIYG